MPFGAVLKELQRSSKGLPSINGSVTGLPASDGNQPISRSEALRSAASAGDFDRVKELCKKSVAIDADGEGRTALHYASLNGHLQIVKEIISVGAKVNVKDASGFTPLHLACSEGHVEIVNLLLRSGALIDSQDELQGNTPLHEAAWKGFRQTAEVLMKHKANPYIKNKGGFSALHLACQQGHNGSARVLLVSRCKPDLKNNYGDTPLHTAARYGHAGVARILISAFCDVSQVNKNGDTALHITAAMGRRKLTKLLLQAGCDPTLKNQQNETPMDIALRKSFKEVQEIIANPPPLRLQRSVSMTRFMSKKREKESSQEGSKTSGRRARKDRLLKKESPYGCPRSPDLREFPKLKIDSLPSDPLKRGEQYYFDLAGNIKKGPVNRVPTCSCKPLFEKVEMKMDVDKQELKDHIDCKSEHLKEKIGVLEKKTVDIGETLKEKIACERAQCIERTLRTSLRDKIEYERNQLMQVEQLKGDMKHWLESRLSASCGQLHVLNQQQQEQQPPEPSSCNFDLTRPNDHLSNHHSQSTHAHPHRAAAGHNQSDAEDSEDEDEDPAADLLRDQHQDGGPEMQKSDNHGKASVKRSSSSSCFPSHSEVVPAAQASDSEKTTAEDCAEILLPDRKTHVRFAPTSSNRRQAIDDEAAAINFPPPGGSPMSGLHSDMKQCKSSMRLHPQPVPRSGPSSRSPLHQQSLIPQVVHQQPPSASSTYQSFQPQSSMFPYQHQHQQLHILPSQQHGLLTRHVHPQSLTHHHHQQPHLPQHHLLSAGPSAIKIPFSGPLHNHHQQRQQMLMHHPNCQPKISVSIPDVLGSSGGSLGTASGGSAGSGSGSACPQFMPANASPDEASSDLMKSLRCNPTWTSLEMRDSPNTESSGYRTKFSPSPREQAGINQISGSMTYLGQLSSSLV